MRVFFTIGDFFCRAANFSALSRSMYTRANDSLSEYVTVTSQ